MKKGRILSAVLLAFVCMWICSACAFPVAGKKKLPVTITIWHVYGGQTDSPLNNQIDEFNRTVGKEKGINVQVTCVTNTNTIHEMVLAAANHDPGAASLPDMFVSYPKTVLAMPDSSILTDYRDYFSEKELSAFIPEFINEGEINNRLLILPVAKSTEILYVNKTIFDRFAAETGASLTDLSTWEGLFETAVKYTRWSDEKTPDVPNDGKTFFVHDYHFNYFQVGTESLGEAFFNGNKLAFGNTLHERVWKPYAKAAVQGAVWLQGGYATEPLRTGDSICSVASSASILYYSDVVTYPDNTSENIEIISLPCPVFRGGEKLVMQRGAGICTVKSTPEKEKACMTFLKWITEPERNVSFVTSAGYMPVTKDGFDRFLSPAIDKLTSKKYISLYKAFQQTRADYKFYTAPQLSTYMDLETAFESGVRQDLTEERKKFKDRFMNGSPNEAELNSLTEECYRKFTSSFKKD